MSEAGSEGRGLSPAGAGDARARGAVRVSTPVVLAHLRVLRDPWGCLQRAEEQRLSSCAGLSRRVLSSVSQGPALPLSHPPLHSGDIFFR